MKNNCCDFKLPNPIEFCGCDGKPWSDEFLLEQMYSAVEKEDYLFADKCKKEIDRRKQEQSKVYREG